SPWRSAVTVCDRVRVIWASPSEDFDQAGRAHAAADAHGHHAPFGAAPLALVQDMARHPRARHAIGMAHRDRPARDVQLLGIDTELDLAVQRLRSESLV